MHLQITLIKTEPIFLMMEKNIELKFLYDVLLFCYKCYWFLTADEASTKWSKCKPAYRSGHIRCNYLL